MTFLKKVKELLQALICKGFLWWFSDWTAWGLEVHWQVFFYLPWVKYIIRNFPTLILDPRKDSCREWAWRHHWLLHPSWWSVSVKVNLAYDYQAALKKSWCPTLAVKYPVPTLFHLLLLEDAEEDNGSVAETLQPSKPQLRKFCFF